MCGRMVAGILLMLSGPWFFSPLSGAEIDVVWEVDCAPGRIDELVAWHTDGVSLIECAEAVDERVICLGLPAKPEKPAVDLLFPAVPVEAEVKYRLSFRARLEGPDTVTENPQLEYLFFHYDKGVVGKNLPGWGLRFSDAAGQERRRRLPIFHTVVMHREWRTYTETFYAPPEASQVQVSFSNRKNPDNLLYVDQIRIERLADGCLNINPEFGDGPEDYSGYNYGVRQRLVSNAAGGWRLDANAGWFSGDPIPVVPEGEYQLTVQLETVDKIGRLSLHLLDGAWAKAGVLQQTIRQSAVGRQTHCLDFIVPAGVSWLRLVGGGGYFERIVLQKVQPKNVE